MKKIIGSLFIIGLFMTSCNQKIEKSEENMKEFVTTCTNEAKKSYSETFTDQQINTYCECSAGKALDEFNAGELVKLNAPAQYPELQERMLKVIQPCIDDLAK